MAQTRRRHPALEGTPKGVWQPEAVGKVNGYPATAEEYARRVKRLKATSDKARAEGRTNRRGVPNGWAGRGEEVEQLRQGAEIEALQRIQTLYRSSHDPDERLAADTLDKIGARPIRNLTHAEISKLTDAEKGAVALAYAASVALSPAYGTAARLRAAKILLQSLIPKPTTGRLVTGLDEALHFLDALVKEEPPPEM